MVVLTQGVLFFLVYLFGPTRGVLTTRLRARRRAAEPTAGQAAA